MKYIILLITAVLIMAILSTIVSQNSKTADIISSFSKIFSSILGIVVSPIQAAATPFTGGGPQ